MAQWNSAIEVTFNDNDGKAGWRVNSESVNDYRRHCHIFGIWRARWILLKRFWIGLKHLEHLAERDDGLCGANMYWIFKPEIPE